LGWPLLPLYTAFTSDFEPSSSSATPGRGTSSKGGLLTLKIPASRLHLYTCPTFTLFPPLHVYTQKKTAMITNTMAADKNPTSKGDFANLYVALSAESFNKSMNNTVPLIRSLVGEGLKKLI
jgi:hypothetical protein